MKALTVIILVISLLFIAQIANAEIVTRSVEYQDGDQVLEGYLAYDDALSGERPGVLIIHQWMGLSDYEKMRARMLAELGYVAFALDMYGVDQRPQNREEASAQTGEFYGNVDLLRQRAQAGLETLRAHELSMDGEIAVIGYCFGGKCALEVARSGADIAGAVSFHGGLDTPDTTDAQNIQCPILVCHGAQDPHVDGREVIGFYREMSAADVDYIFIAYAGAVHSFTQESAGSDPSKGSAYNAKADQRSWEHMQDFFGEIFPAGEPEK